MKNTEIFHLSSDENENDRILKYSAEVIKNGGLVVFPTETVYGLGANALSKDAAKKIYEAKGRPSDNPLIIHLASASDAEKYCVVPEIFYSFANKFMPGPLTVIMPKKDIVPYEVTGGLDTVAVRVPENKVANKLIKYAGVPIAAPSANVSGRPSPTKAAHVIEDLFGRVDIILDGGESVFGLESTIIKLDFDSVQLLRPGKITPEDLKLVTDNIIIDPSILKKMGENERPTAPGMKYRHYSPKADLVILEGGISDIRTFMKGEYMKTYIGILCYDEDISYICGDETDKQRLVSMGKINSPEEHAHNLFAALRNFDTNTNVKTIYTYLPSRQGVGFAVYNRMMKASGHTIKKL